MRWKLGGEAEGKKLLEEALKETAIIMTITGNRYSVKSAGEIIEEGTYKTDSAKVPKTIDVVILRGEDKGKTQLGIYKLEGNTATFSMARLGAKTRPSSFTTKPGAGFEVTVLRRQET